MAKPKKELQSRLYYRGLTISVVPYNLPKPTTRFVGSYWKPYYVILRDPTKKVLVGEVVYPTNPVLVIEAPMLQVGSSGS